MTATIETTTNEPTASDDQCATVAPPHETQPSQGNAAAQRSDRWGRGPSFDQFILSLLPLTLAVALAFGIIAYAAIRVIPAGDASSSAAAPAAGDAPITAFAEGTVTQQVAVAADPSGALKWDKTTYEAQAGDVTFVVTNKSNMPHNFAVEGGNVKAQGPNFGSNTTTTYTLKGLKPGTYEIVCNFPGHKLGGMVATLIVR